LQIALERTPEGQLLLAPYLKLRHKLAPKLSQITTPTLIRNSRGDKTIAPGAAQEIFRRLGATKKSIHCYGDDVPPYADGTDPSAAAGCHAPLPRIS
jgi:esterase/lipase